MGENISVWVGVVGGLFTIIGSIVGAVMFVKSNMKEYADEAYASALKDITTHKSNQELKDTICENERANINDSVSSLTNKGILLDDELRNPDGVYSRLKGVESQLTALQREIDNIRATLLKG